MCLCLTLTACAGKTPAPTAEPDPQTDPGLQPPRFEGAAETQPKPESRSAFAGTRPAIFDAAWTLLRDKHYDRQLGGVDWNAVRSRYEPMAMGAPDEATFYRVMNEMMGELRQSHLFITGPGDESELGPSLDDPGDASTTGLIGNPGLTVRVVGPGAGVPLVASVRPQSSAARAGIRPGDLITHVGGRPLSGFKPRRAQRPVEERFAVRRLAHAALAGPAGSQVTVTLTDAEGEPQKVVLKRDPPSTAPVQIGNLGPLYPEVSSRQIGNVGYVAFNFFLLEPVLKKVVAAIDQFRQRKVQGLIIDLRGNPGGVAAMAIPLARHLVKQRTPLGTLKHRDHENALVVEQSLDATPYLGPLVILVDESTASTAEIFAAGLQEAGRAKVVGSVTLGQALPSVIEELPGGAILQYVVADFKTPKGVALEGRGVIPDRPVVETRAALQAGQDPTLEAALQLLRRKGV